MENATAQDSLNKMHQRASMTNDPLTCPTSQYSQHCCHQKRICMSPQKTYIVSVCSGMYGWAWTVACQAPLSMGFSRQEYWSGCHFLLQGIFSTQESNPLVIPVLAGRFFTTMAQDLCHRYLQGSQHIVGAQSIFPEWIYILDECVWCHLLLQEGFLFPRRRKTEQALGRQNPWEKPFEDLLSKHFDRRPQWPPAGLVSTEV